VVLKAVDEHGNLLPYASDAVNLELEGDIEIIGPKYISLIGGAIAFWVKTKGKSCNAAVTVKSEKYGDQKLEFKVQA
jgi:beta-galactosidase